MITVNVLDSYRDCLHTGIMHCHKLVIKSWQVLERLMFSSTVLDIYLLMCIFVCQPFSAAYLGPGHGTLLNDARGRTKSYLFL